MKKYLPGGIEGLVFNRFLGPGDQIAFRGTLE
jgi:hypothetical protein